jgi:hypothetical protein
MGVTAARLVAVLRGVAAVLAGYALMIAGVLGFFRLASVDPEHAPGALLLVTTVAVGAVLALAGGYAAAAIAGRWQLGHAAALAGLTAIVAVASLVSRVHASSWSQLTALLIMAPLVLVGGWIRARRGHPAR